MRRSIVLSAFALTALLVSGCDNSVTQNDVKEQTEKVEELTANLEELEAEQKIKIDEAASYARQEERDKVAEEIKEARAELQQEQAKLAAISERVRFESEFRRKLEESEKQIQALEEQADNAEGDREIQLRKESAELRTKYVQTERRFDELKAASGDKWTGMKTSVEEAWTDLSDTVEKQIGNTRQTPVETEKLKEGAKEERTRKTLEIN